MRHRNANGRDTMIVQPYYQTLTDFGSDGFPGKNAGDNGSFSDACDDYGAAIEKGWKARVFYCTPPITTGVGLMLDVTAYAVIVVKARLEARS